MNRKQRRIAQRKALGITSRSKNRWKTPRCYSLARQRRRKAAKAARRQRQAA